MARILITGLNKEQALYIAELFEDGSISDFINEDMHNFRFIRHKFKNTKVNDLILEPPIEVEYDNTEKGRIEHIVKFNTE